MPNAILDCQRLNEVVRYDNKNPSEEEVLKFADNYCRNECTQRLNGKYKLRCELQIQYFKEKAKQKKELTPAK